MARISQALLQLGESARSYIGVTNDDLERLEEALEEEDELGAAVALWHIKEQHVEHCRKGGGFVCVSACVYKEEEGVSLLLGAGA